MYLQEETEKDKLISGKSGELAHKLARYAQQAVLYEAVLSPKPGLVDPVDTGSHKDMNILTFMDSASSMYKGFYDFAKMGFEHKGHPGELFKKIRKIGIEVEKTMFYETKGVNTHKGIIFSMGIVLAATAYSMDEKEYASSVFPVWSSSQSESVFQIVKQMTEGLTMEDFGKLGAKKTLTHGERLYVEHGFLGIRKEAEDGFPSVRKFSLPNLRETAFRQSSQSENDRYLETLFILMSMTEDSTIVSRGGLDALLYVKGAAKKFLSDGGMRQKDVYDKIELMNQQFKEKWISPGGSADLLAVTIYFCKLEAID